MLISDHFKAVSFKSLAQVDLPGGSNQHEVGSPLALRKVFGETEISGEMDWYFFSDSCETQKEKSRFTYYDSRRKNPNRAPEWRLYYYSEFLECASPGDILILAVSNSDVVYGLVFENGSSWLKAGKILFELESPEERMKLVSDQFLNQSKLEFTKQLILEELEIDYAFPIKPNDEQIITDKFGKEFPRTSMMSQFAREQIEVDISKPDEALLLWLKREEELFKALESILVREKINAGFTDVEDFISYSLSVQNRRKSRMGYALENHLTELFENNSIRYERGKTTEGKRKPDFLFPGQSEYLLPDYDAELLVMLGVKSSCKERWRQVLAEADRIDNKHLCTLEAGISESQMDEMKSRNLTLVIPEEVQSTYSVNQVNCMLSIEGFIDYVKFTQRNL